MTVAENDQAYLKLRNILMMPKDKLSMELLKIWYSLDDAELLTAGPYQMIGKDRFTVEEYAEKADIPEDKVREAFERMGHRSVLNWYVSKTDGKKRYFIPPLFPGLVEYFIINNRNSIDERRAFIKKFHSSESEGGMLVNLESKFSVFRIVPGTKPDPAGRLVEVNKTLEVDKSQVLAYTDVEQIIKQAAKYEDSIAIMPCTCRIMSMFMKTSPECERTVGNCMAFGAIARYLVEEEIGRYATVDEAMDILKNAEKEGLVHLTRNTEDGHDFICNCCTCCCGILGSAVKMNNWNIFQKSDFVPVIDEEKCNKCKKCIKTCQFYALVYKGGEKEDKSEDKIQVREDICIGCGICASNCPTEAMNLKKIRDEKPAKTFIEALTKMMMG